jgi:hypothetical protein
MATRGGRISLPWPLGWIVATPSGRIYHFFGVRRKSRGRWRWLTASIRRKLAVGGGSGQFGGCLIR